MSELKNVPARLAMLSRFCFLGDNIMNKLKDPKTIDQQIELLKTRGLVIDDDSKAAFILMNINYYRLTAYLLPFKKSDDSYVEGTTFEQIYEAYMFEKKLRLLLTGILGTVEISFRTYIAYTLSINHSKEGAYAYSNYRNFINKDYHQKFILILKKEKENNKNNLFIKHHDMKYDGKLPIWVATEIMTFSTISKLYSNLLPEDKSFIKKEMCHENVDSVESWLHSLTHLRNQCAHYGRIYNATFPTVRVKKSDKKYKLNTEQLFAYIVAIKYLVADIDIWNMFHIELENLINQYVENIDLNLMGFPSNWSKILNKNYDT